MAIGQHRFPLWDAAKAGLEAGSPLQPPQVLFPKLDKDYIAELAELHKEGKARLTP